MSDINNNITEQLLAIIYCIFEKLNLYKVYKKNNKYPYAIYPKYSFEYKETTEPILPTTFTSEIKIEIDKKIKINAVIIEAIFTNMIYPFRSLVILPCSFNQVRCSINGKPAHCFFGSVIDLETTPRAEIVV